MIGTYCIVRTQNAGVFAATLDSLVDGNAVLKNSRRLWYWDGAASLSQVAVDGVSRPKSCKFPCEVEQMLVLGVIEVIPCTEKARRSIAEVPVWSA